MGCVRHFHNTKTLLSKMVTNDIHIYRLYIYICCTPLDWFPVNYVLLKRRRLTFCFAAEFRNQFLLVGNGYYFIWRKM